MMTIWKFSLRGGEENQFWTDMPLGAHVLSCGYQGRDFVVWAMVDPAMPNTRRRFHVAGTGHPLPEDITARLLVGRVEIATPSGLLQFHVFDMGGVR